MSIISWPLDKWLDNVALAALSSKETLLATFDLARNVIERGIPGDFVECGVFGGAQCAAMARALMGPNWKGGPIHGTLTRRVHLFDSFQGIPASGEHDAEWTHAPGVSICTLEAVKDHMTEWGIPDELLVYHPGWFERTLTCICGDDETDPLCPAETCPESIALLRLDADLYESTKICVEELYPLVSPGGWIIVDDFSLSGARKAFLEVVPDTGPVYMQRHPS